jgi:hypothetical protein
MSDDDLNHTTPPGHLASGGALVRPTMTEKRATYLREKSRKDQAAKRVLDSIKAPQLKWVTK